MDLVAERISGTSSRSVVDVVEAMWALTGSADQEATQAADPKRNLTCSQPPGSLRSRLRAPQKGGPQWPPFLVC